MNEFKKLVGEVNSNNCNAFLSPLTITLGDEFQGVVRSLKDSVKIILDIEEQILNSNIDFKLRYVLNYGKIDTPINPKIAYEMLGEGLTSARTLLEKAKKDSTRFLINVKNNAQSKKLNLAFNILQSFADDWNYKDYKIVSEFLANADYKIVAHNLNKDKSLMWRREKSLKMKEYRSIKELILRLV